MSFDFYKYNIENQSLCCSKSLVDGFFLKLHCSLNANIVFNFNVTLQALSSLPPTQMSSPPVDL